MTFYLSQILALLVFIFILSSLLTRNKWLRLAFLFLGTLFTILELSSVIIGDSLIDFKYYAHMNLRVIEEVGGYFLKEIIILALLPPALALGLWWLGGRLSDTIRSRLIPSLLVLLLTGGFMSMKGGVMANLFEIIQLHLAKRKAFDEALAQLGLNGYVEKSVTQARPGKNIIVIAMESLEASFLQGKMAHLTPNLQRLASDMHYYPMEQAPGSDYTIAAIYTYLTGFPYFFKNHGNEVFDRALDLRVNSIAHALEVAGYQQEYLLGNPSFAGMGKMMELMGFTVKSEADFDLKFKHHQWGLHDKDLFDLAKMELEKLIEQQQPYSLFISTISTHPPDGLFDPRMAAAFPEQASNLELMVMALDQHVGELVEFLKAAGQLEETAIFIMPDHLLMGNEARVLNEFPNHRSLFLITNSETPSYDPGQTILQADVPKMILDGAGVRHNLSFMTEMIEGDKLAFIEKNKPRFVQLNEASLIVEEPEKIEVTEPAPKKGLSPKENYLIVRSVPGTAEGIQPSEIYLGQYSLMPGRGVNLLVHLGDGRYQHEVYDTYENPPMVESLLKRLQELIGKRQYFVALVHDSAGEQLQAKAKQFEALGMKIGQLHNRQAYIALSDYGLTSDEIRDYPFHVQLPLVPRKSRRSTADILAAATDTDRFIAHAGGAIDGIRYTNSIEAMDLAYENGYRLIELDIIRTSDGHFVGSHNWEFWQSETGYEEEIPPDLETFRKYKFRGKYRLADMEMINEWFRKHPDAILVTDKVNDPEAFVPQFIDRNRLMMELFSFQAIEAAQKLGIRGVMLTENLLQYLGKDKAAALQERQIEYVAASRRAVEADTGLFTKIKEAGIKVYAYHINDDPLYDEAYCIRQLMDFSYGLYADYWNLNSEITPLQEK